MIARVSVVIPFRNGARWLPATLASLAAQEGVSYELVAVDDHSTDGSAAVVERCWGQLGTPAPLRLIRGEGLGGVSAARNSGWRAAQAPLVAFLDADDLCLADRLAAQALEMESDPHLGQVLCGWRRFEGEGIGGCEGGAGENGFDVMPWLEGAGFDLEPAFRLKAVLPSAWMLRRSVLDQAGGFDPGLHHAEDVDLLLRLALAGVRGAWVKRVLCGYRLHRGGASRRLRPQSQALLWVLGRRIQELPAGHPLVERGPELLFGARSWSAWKAWSEGEAPLALELWRGAWGLSSQGPARSWLSLAQTVESGSRREGIPFRPEDLLADPTWAALEDHVVGCLLGCDRHAFPAPVPDTQASGAASHQQGWSLLAYGYGREGLLHWQRQLRRELEALEPEGCGPWSPAALGQAWSGDRDPVGLVRQRALAWCADLLAWDGAQEGVTHRIQGLQELLVAWAGLSWGQSAANASARLEQAFALRPDPRVLMALARLYAPHAPTGALALERLARRLNQEGARSAQGSAHSPLNALQGLPSPRRIGSRCQGPGCLDCGLASVSDWSRTSLAPGCELWQPPALAPQATANASPLRLWRLPAGRAWLRPPLLNPWGSSGAVVVADQNGQRMEELCRRYPQPWPGCRVAVDPAGAAGIFTDESAASEPEPDHPPLELAGPVLAVADLSAEIHYHWLLEQLPRLGLALEALDPGERAAVRVWHNGGADPGRLQTLIELLELDPSQLIDAREHPHLRAELLLVPAFSGRFGWPSPQAQGWLRERLQAQVGAGPRRRIWLSRRPTARRPVWGETELLERLEAEGLPLEPVDLAELSLREQAQMLSEAELVVAPHGGALASLVFARAGTRVLELHQPRYAPPYFHGIVQAQALRFARCVQPIEAPLLYRELVFEGPLCEPICLDPDRCVQAVRALISSP